jgi:hypothetical protein
VTLREADEAAVKRLPVICGGLEYERITRTGYRYDEKGQRFGFIELYDRRGNSVTYAKPEAVELKNKKT